MSEKLCLKWNDFQENVNTAFANLRGNNDFSDVTLACEDGQQFEAHKVILVASSPFFYNLLKIKKHNHPLIYMRGVKSEDLVAILDFFYCGEANIFQENLDSFLAIAEELKLKGLMGQNDSKRENTQKELYSSPNAKKTEIKPVLKQATTSMNVSADQQLINVDYDHHDQIVAIPKYLSGNLQGLDEQVKSMIEKSQNLISNGKGQTRAYICKVCGKEGAPQTIKDHIETRHLEGVSLPCNTCGKTFRSRTTLRRHNCRNMK